MSALVDVAPPILVGIILQEAIHWYKLAGALNRPATKELLRNPAYWIFFMTVCIFGTLFVYYLTENGSYQPRDLILMGAAVPSMFREVVSGAKSRKLSKLGSVPGVERTSSIAPYFT
jgi:hypothetical protein